MSESMSSEIADKEWVNPYRVRLGEYPGRIFLLEGDEAEQRDLEARIGAASNHIVELGSGSGQHLIEVGRRNPGVSCWGFEIRYKRTVRTVEKAEQAGVKNIFMLRTPAQRLGMLFPSRSLQGIYVNFPDPWARPKQWKHRLLGPYLLEQASRLLVPGGFLSAKTDHRDYFQAFLPVLRADSRFEITELSEDLAQSEFSEANIVTEFESLFRSQGLPVSYVRAVVRGSP